MIKTYERTAKLTELKAYCYFSKPEDFMEVTEWYNGEGFDVAMSEGSDVALSEAQRFSLTWGQFHALQALIHHAS